MAVEFRTSTTGEVNATDLLTTISGTAAVGDVAIAVWSTGSATDTLTPPSGWTQVDVNVVTNSMTVSAWYKTLTSGDIGVAQTWTKSNSGKHVVAIAVYSGVDGVAPLGGFGAFIGYVVSGADRLTPAAAYTGRAIEFAASKGTDPGPFSVPGSHTIRAAVDQSASGSITTSIADSTTALAGGTTFSLAAAWPQATTGGLWLVEGEPAPPTPGTFIHMWTGAPTSGSAVTVTCLSGATSVRLAVSTSPAMTSPTYVSAQVPNASGYVRHEVSGLAQNTRYYFQAADTPSGGSEVLIGDIGTIMTLGTPGDPLALREVALGSCIRTGTANTLAVADVVTWAPDYGIFLGDFFYNGSQSTVESEWIAKYTSQISSVAGLKELVASGIAGYEVPSDHDTTNIDNGDSDGPQAPYEQSAWRKVVPFGTTGASDVRDQQWDDGRVSYFMVDCRNPHRSPGTDVDGPGKTMLGAAQLARLLDWLSTSTSPFKVLVADVGWMGAADIVEKPDSWWSYAYERQVIIDAIAAQDEHVEIWHGDSHLIGYATAEDNTWGNVPVICAAPYESPGGGRNTNTFTQYFNNGGNAFVAQEYGRITITDDGSTITRTFSGWDAVSGTEKMSFVTEVSTVGPTGPVAFLETATGLVNINSWHIKTDTGLVDPIAVYSYDGGVIYPRP